MPVPVIAAGAATGTRVVAGGASKAAAKSAAASTKMQGVKPVSRSSGSPISASAEKAKESVQQEGLSRAQNFRKDLVDNVDAEQEEFSNGRMSTQVQYRIGLGVGIILVTFAGLLDVIELVLDIIGTKLAIVGVVFGYIKDFFTIIIFPIIFLLLRAPFWKGKKAKKKLAVMIGAAIVSLIPWIGAFTPETFAGVLITIYLTRKEDEEKAQTSLVSASVTRFKRIRRKTRR